jgi:prepilin signal peptidase PulO-like enzyme (type II secretory pathway)
MMNQNMLPSIISLLMLLAAALQDIKSREISDLTWAFGCLLGIIINLNNYSWSYIPKAIFFLLFLSVIWIMKLMGEADILAYASLLVTQPSAAGYIPPAMATFIYSNLLLLSAPLYNFVKNLKNLKMLDEFDEPYLKKILSLFLIRPAYRRDLERIKYYDIAEIYVNGRKKLDISRSLSGIKKGEIPDREPVWIIPTYPLMPFILAGHILTLMLGDPVGLIFGRVSY